MKLHQAFLLKLLCRISAGIPAAMETFDGPFGWERPAAPVISVKWADEIVDRSTAMSHKQQLFEATISAVDPFLTTHVEREAILWTLDRHYTGWYGCDESQCPCHCVAAILLS